MEKDFRNFVLLPFDWKNRSLIVPLIIEDLGNLNLTANENIL